MYIQGTLDGAQTLGALGRMSWTLERYKCQVCVLGTLEVNTLGHHSSGYVYGGGSVHVQDMADRPWIPRLLDPSSDPHPQSFLLWGEGQQGPRELGLRCPAGVCWGC